MLQKFNIPFPAMWRIAVGFLLASINMIFGAVIQWRVYQASHPLKSSFPPQPILIVSSDLPLWLCRFDLRHGIAGISVVADSFIHITSRRRDIRERHIVRDRLHARTSTDEGSRVLDGAVYFSAFLCTLTRTHCRRR